MKELVIKYITDPCLYPVKVAELGTVFANWELKDDCISIISMINGEKGNGDFELFMSAFKSACIEEGKGLILEQFENKRLYEHFVKKGFAVIDDNTLFKSFEELKKGVPTGTPKEQQDIQSCRKYNVIN